VKFFCPSCRVTFSVPDDRIPVGKELKILCPKCRTQVEKLDEPNPEAFSVAESSALPADVSNGEDENEYSADFDIVEEGAGRALICSSDIERAEKIERQLKQINFHVSVASNGKAAIERIHRNRLDLVILDELYGSANQGAKGMLLQHIQLLPMHVRRQFFLCLISDVIPTFDHMLGFRMGVDLILNTRDLEKIKVVLVRAMKEHKHFYRVYAEEMEKRGQF